MTVVDEQVTMDGLRVVETHGDGTTTSRVPTLGEQVGALSEDIERQVRGMVPHAVSSTISLAEHGDENVVLSIVLSRAAQAPALSDGAPAAEGEKAKAKPKKASDAAN